jgi:hypothetical protein
VVAKISIVVFRVKVEVIYSSEILVTTYRITLYDNPKGHN